MNIDVNTVYASEIIAKMVESEAHFLMPELLKIVKIFATMPTTSAQAERSFSTLRRLKTYLRSTMGQERLSSLTLMSMEREVVNRVLESNMEGMIDTFGRKNGRDSQFF